MMIVNGVRSSATCSIVADAKNTHTNGRLKIMGAGMKRIKINVPSVLKMAKDRGIDGIEALCEESGISSYKLFRSRLLTYGMASLPDIMKISKRLDVPPYFVTCVENTEHEYWFVADEEFPVDVDYCRKCKYWSKYSCWCTYYEHTGKLLPDGHIIVHEDGRHTCSCREIGKHERIQTLGIVERRGKP